MSNAVKKVLFNINHLQVFHVERRKKALFNIKHPQVFHVERRKKGVV